jgi:endonuclease/exonuclease/phosphatase (EEP) superfamily protein YafD
MSSPSSPESTVRGRLARLLRRWLALALVAGILLEAWAWLWPDDLGDRSGPALALAYLRFQLRTFWVHAGIAWVALGAVALVLRSWRLTLSAWLAAAVALGPMAWTYTRSIRGPTNADPIAGPNADSLRVMSINLLLWNRQAGLVKDQIDRFGPDVICLQEYTPGMAAELRPLLEGPYPHIVESPQRSSFGQAVYSRLAFVGEPEIYPQLDWLRGDANTPRTIGVIGSGDPQIRVVVRVGAREGGSEVVIQNVHLSTPATPEYYNEQRAMVRWLADWASRERGPIVIAGDFNNTPFSVEARRLGREGLVEVHAAVGRGLGDTWPKSNYWRRVPGIRLDQIWTRGLEPTWSHVGGSISSDHRPVAGEWVLPLTGLARR